MEEDEIFFFIFSQWFDLSVYPYFEIETNAHKICNMTNKLYEYNNVQNKSYFIKKLVNMNSKYGESMVEKGY